MVLCCCDDFTVCELNATCSRKDSRFGLWLLIVFALQESSATVYLNGAHVTSWKTAYGEERLFVSRQAIFKPPKAIRYSCIYSKDPSSGFM